MDKTLAAIYVVTRNDLKTHPSHWLTSNRQGVTADNKSKRVNMLSLVFTFGLAITPIKEALLKKQSD